MEKLFSCFTGSRLYGTNTPTSDLDVKHVYLPALDDLLVGKPLANKVKKTNTVKNTRNGADDVDEEFLPIQVFARDFLEGQTYALELAFAVEGKHAGQTLYKHELPVVDEGDEAHLWFNAYGFPPVPENMFVLFVRELRAKFLTSNVKALMGYAVNQATLYSFKGERLNVVRDVLSVLCELALADENQRLGFHATDFRFAALATKYPKYFKLTQYDIGDGQMRPCFTLLEKTLPFTNSLEMSVKVVKNLADKYGNRAAAATVDNVDWKATMHALRVVDEGLQLLETHGLTLPLPKEKVDKLLAVKRGEVPLEEVKQELDEKLERLKELETATDLPPLTPQLRDQFNVWLASWMRKFYLK
jgi:hypothetical protein